MALKVVTAHIPAGQSISNGVDCTEGTIIRIAAPTDDWDGANISFQVNTEDGEKYHDLMDHKGQIIQLPVKVSASLSVREVIGLDPGWYKIRSGTREHPVNQKGDRDFSFVMLTDTAAAPAASPQRSRMIEQER